MSSPWFLQAGGKTMNAAAEQHQQNGFLHMQTILRLFEYHRMRRIDDCVGDFFTAMRRQTVHEDRMLRSIAEQLVINLIAAEDLLALRGFVFLSHTGPDIGIDRVRPTNG